MNWRHAVFAYVKKTPSPMKAGPGRRAVDPLLRKDNTCDVESGRLGLAQREFLLLRHCRPEERGDPHAGDARENEQRAAVRSVACNMSAARTCGNLMSGCAGGPEYGRWVGRYACDRRCETGGADNHDASDAKQLTIRLSPYGSTRSREVESASGAKRGNQHP